MSISDISDSRPGGRPITIEDFRVCRSYLSVLLGEAGERILARVGGRAEESTNDGTISSVHFLNTCLEYMRLEKDESLGLAAQPVPIGTFGVIAAAAAQADDFEGALLRLAEAGRLLRQDVAIEVSRTRDGLELRLRWKGERSARAEMMIEIFAVTVHCALRWLTGRQVRLAQIKVAQPLPGFERSLLYRLMGCPVTRHRTGVTLRFSPEAGSIPLQPVKYQAWAAQELGEFMCLLTEAAAASNAAAASCDLDIVQRVREAISAGSRSGTAAARKLGMSPATLRRRLSKAGRSFRAIAADMQRIAVESLIVTDKPLEDIAAEIGYSDVRSLRRACRRWFGVTPTDYRRTGGLAVRGATRLRA